MSPNITRSPEEGYFIKKRLITIMITQSFSLTRERTDTHLVNLGISHQLLHWVLWVKAIPTKHLNIKNQHRWIWSHHHVMMIITRTISHVRKTGIDIYRNTWTFYHLIRRNTYNFHLWRIDTLKFPYFQRTGTRKFHHL